MDNNQNKTLNCTGADADNELCKVSDEKVLLQFKIIIIVVFIILLIFLGAFIYARTAKHTGRRRTSRI